MNFSFRLKDEFMVSGGSNTPNQIWNNFLDGSVPNFVWDQIGVWIDFKVSVFGPS